MEPISAQRRREIIDALRRGTVPQRGLDVFAVGLERFEPALDEELRAVAAGGAGFKAVRGEYGSGKTFFARWLQERAKRLGFATAEVQISETETPLHRLETVYRRAMERLSTADTLAGRLPAGRRRLVLRPGGGGPGRGPGRPLGRRRRWRRRPRRCWRSDCRRSAGPRPSSRSPCGATAGPRPRATPPRPTG